MRDIFIEFDKIEGSLIRNESYILFPLLFNAGKQEMICSCFVTCRPYTQAKNGRETTVPTG